MYYPCNLGLVIFSGKDCLNFLNSMSTNLVEESLFPLSTSICDNKGKLINHLTLFKIGDVYPAICHMGNPSNLIEYLLPKTLTQEVDIRDVSKLNVMNYKISDKLSDGVSKIESSTLIKITKKLGILISPVSDYKEHDKISEAEWNNWRIRNLYPIFPNEISRKLTPYNCGLEDYVHTSKGCYTGQEILTRMKSRNSFGRTLQVVNNDELNGRIPTTRGAVESFVISK